MPEVTLKCCDRWGGRGNDGEHRKRGVLLSIGERGVIRVEGRVDREVG